MYTNKKNGYEVKRLEEQVTDRTRHRHTTDKAKLQNRLKRIEGQVRGVQKIITETAIAWMLPCTTFGNPSRTEKSKHALLEAIPNIAWQMRLKKATATKPFQN